MKRRDKRRAAAIAAALAFLAPLPALAQPFVPGPEVVEAARAGARIADAIEAFDRALEVVLARTPRDPSVAVAEPPADTLARTIDRLVAESDVVGDAATLLLDDALVGAAELDAATRARTRALARSHLDDADAALASACERLAGEAVPRRAALARIEVAERRVTCERLAEVHALLT